LGIRLNGKNKNQLENENILKIAGTTNQIPESFC
jgi:hypothetical protein